MGVVYLAHNKMMGRDEVLKVMGAESSIAPECLTAFSARFRNRGETAPSEYRYGLSCHSGRRQHHLCDGVCAGARPGADGQGQGTLQVIRASNFIYQAALAFSTPHEEGLVHRDIKPGNLMLTRNGDKAAIKILDFGLAKASREEKVDLALTHEGPSPWHARLHRPGTDSRRAECGYSGGHLQPGSHSVFPLDRAATVPGEDRL